MTKKDNVPLIQMGVSNHNPTERAENDFYTTDPIAVNLLHHTGLLDKKTQLWECACGNGAISERLIDLGYDVLSTDLYDRGYGESGVDFLKQPFERFDGDIITNPPFKLLDRFIIKGLYLTGRKLFIFCNIMTISGQKRYNLIFKENPPQWILPFVKRINCYRDGKPMKNSSAICYAWFIWDIEDEIKETKVKWLI